MSLTAERLREVLDYSPDTGIFKWRVRLPHSRATAGSSAGTINQDGYRQIAIDNKCYVAHRLAWLYVYGHWFAGGLDHIDCDRSNNRLKNLRAATPSQNRANSRLRRNSKSGLKGVSFNYGWRAFITINGIQHRLGRFSTPEEAHAAYCAAAIKHFGEFARFS